MDENTILKVKGLSKSFLGVQALSNVDFTLKRGEIHALMGENGAGKSTLIKCITGVHRRDSGEILYKGKPLDCTSPLQAQSLGISPVYQEVNLVPNLSVAENLFLGRHPRKGGRILWREQSKQAKTILREFDLDLDVDKPLGAYPVAIQQMVAIARALELKSEVLILDEPTSSLNVNETQHLFEQMRRLKREGQAIIFITHFLDQVYEVCDTITVLRNGLYVGTYPASELPKPQLISKLLGKELEKLADLTGRRKGVAKAEDTKVDAQGRDDVLIQAKNLGRSGKIKPFDLTIYRGEVLGCAGLLGSGRTEMANVFFGIDPADSGTLTLEGKEVSIRNPRDALRHGIGLSPEDRKEQGIIGDLSVRENIILALQNRQGWRKTLSFQEQTEIAEKFIEMLSIKTPSPEQAIKNLSGGNQQKVIIARWLAANPKFLILDEPTRGIDVGAKTEIQKLIIDMSAKGLSVMFISSEIEEIARCSTRVLVLHEREMKSIIRDENLSEETIMHHIVEEHV
ncbi:MAG: sugar ABC transporter ATP-binding protein [Spirochaetales bacterium]